MQPFQNKALLRDTNNAAISKQDSVTRHQQCSHFKQRLCYETPAMLPFQNKTLLRDTSNAAISKQDSVTNKFKPRPCHWPALWCSRQRTWTSSWWTRACSSTACHRMRWGSEGPPLPSCSLLQTKQRAGNNTGDPRKKRKSAGQLPPPCSHLQTI